MSSLRLMLIALVLIGIISPGRAAPNVLLVITDDQGYGDLGAHGNPVIRTPALDRFTKEGARLANFYVSPVCSPTRSSLLTGLYNYRTGVVDTYLGRSMMRPWIPTLAEHLKKEGYRTGLFGKWHLGDNAPMRPEDRGFDQTCWIAGGGLAQPADPPAQDPKTAYFNPIVRRNGVEGLSKGYCTDVFTDEAIRFLTSPSDKPFFAYVAYNAPHDPFQIAEELVAPYRKKDLTAAGFPQVGQPWAGPKLNTEAIARAYAMIENVDSNFARLMKALEEKKLAENTLVIFLTDNGPGGVRFNTGLRNRKGTVYEGGIKVPCYVRWPGQIKPGTVEETPLAHIDITPTVLEACQYASPPVMDGRSFWRMLTNQPGNWPGRNLFFQWHRGDVPEKGRAFAVRGPKYKLVQAGEQKPKYELFDLSADPFEQTDLAEKMPDEVERLKMAYDAWFDDVSKLGFNPPRIAIGNANENPVRLSRQDWRGPKAGWNADSVGHWLTRVEKPGQYEVTVISRSEFQSYEVLLSRGQRTQAQAGGLKASHDPNPMTKEMTTRFDLQPGDLKVEATVEGKAGKRGADYVVIRYLGPVVPGK